MAYDYLSVEDRDGVAVVWVDRPPVNALDRQLLAEGSALIDELRGDPPAAVVVAGRPGCFCAGVDLKLAPTLDAAGQREMVDGINRLFGGWYSFERPLVTAITGHAIAGGMILALCGDARVASTEGQHGLTEVRAGIPYPTAAIAIVRAEMPPAASRELVLGGELVSAERAVEIGAYDEVVEPEAVVSRAVERARALAGSPADAYATVKRQLRAPALAEMEAALAGDDPVAAGWLGQETAGAAEALLRSPGER